MSKTLFKTIKLLSMVLFFLVVARQTYAVQGQLNYVFGQPQESIVIKDVKEINDCNKKKDEINTTAQNCLKTNTLLNNMLKEEVKRSENQTQTYKLLLAVVGGVAFILFISTVVFYTKYQKEIASPLTSMDQVPPSTMDDSGRHGPIL
ncbi:hypothetical protein HZC27_01995 [Candidatus Roizmanbacteria bacterium]|nr:hypothetical protein [Candidatus Roizmanbacteria bacterium]